MIGPEPLEEKNEGAAVPPVPVKSFDPGVNDRVKQVRLALEMSQSRFREGISVSAGHYAGIELGKHHVSERILKLIIKIYGVNEAYLRSGEGEMFDHQPDIRLEQLLRDFQALPADLQDFVLQQIAALKKLRRPAPEA